MGLRAGHSLATLFQGGRPTGSADEHQAEEDAEDLHNVSPLMMNSLKFPQLWLDLKSNPAGQERAIPEKWQTPRDHWDQQHAPTEGNICCLPWGEFLLYENSFGNTLIPQVHSNTCDFPGIWRQGPHQSHAGRACTQRLHSICGHNVWVPALSVQ